MIYALSLGGKNGIKRDKKKIYLFCLLDRKKNNFWISLFSQHFQSAELTKEKKNI